VYAADAAAAATSASAAEIKRGSNRSRALRPHLTMGQLSSALALINVASKQARNYDVAVAVIFIVVAATAAAWPKTPATSATPSNFST